MTNPAGELRRCLHCGRPITVPAANPRKRFCSPRCRVADWHRRNDRAPDQASDPDTVPKQAYAANAVPEPRYAANAVPRDVPATRCPHCRQPVTAITLLVPPAAAHVPTPTNTGPTQHA